MPKMDLSVERKHKNKGSYRRILDDAFEALGRLSIKQFRPEAAFVFYYLTCEKLAKVMVAIANGKPGAGQNFRTIKLRSNNIVTACKLLGCSLPKDDIHSIFSNNDGSAGHVRNQLFHDFGPAHVKQIQQAAPQLNGHMKRFLECRNAVIAYLDQRKPVSSVTK